MKVITFVLLCLMATGLSAQTERKRETGQWRIGLGVNSIITPESATLPMIPAFAGDSLGKGGSYDDNYLDFQVSRVFSLDEESRLRYPISVRYMGMSATEKYLISSGLSTKYTNNSDMLSLSNGIEYDFLQFYGGTGYLFVGASLDLNYFFARENTYELDYLLIDERDQIITYTKDDAIRLGGSLTLGVQADFRENIRFNITGSITSLNFLQFNETEGGLFSPLYEVTRFTEENNVITYRLGVNFIYLLYN